MDCKKSSTNVFSVLALFSLWCFIVLQWKGIREMSVFFFSLLLTPSFDMCVFKKWQLKILRETVSSYWSRDKLGLKKKKKKRVLGWGGRQNMTAVAEGDVTYCQGLWHDSLVQWNPTGNIRAVSSTLGAEKRLVLWCQCSLVPWLQPADWDTHAWMGAPADGGLQ